MRPPYLDLVPADLDDDATAFDCCEPKRDGRWTTIDIRDGVARISGRDGQDYGTMTAPAGLDVVLCAEQIVGTERSVRANDRGALVVFDCIAVNGHDLRDVATLAERRDVAAQAVAILGAPYSLVPQWPIAEARARWEQAMASGAEGLVLKRSAAPYGEHWGRLKRVTDADYVLVTVTVDEDGRGASLHGAAYPGGPVVVRARVWDSSVTRAARPGAWFTAIGESRTARGSLRHPRFSRWRTDRAA